MKIKLFFVFSFIFQITIGFSQNKDEEILMTIGKRPITKGEFIRIYKKNNPQEPNDQKQLNQYVELFINFKLKVIEAENLKLDTSSSFKTELAGYRKQLAKPYMMDKKVVDSLCSEAYERLRFELNTSHILVQLSPNATPKDTLLAYQKIQKLRARILKGEDFNAVAKDFSEDESAKSNKGNIGYITAFQTIYPFECAAYNQKIGEVSLPVRTKFGYHLIKVNDRRTNQGQIKVAHIMLVIPKDAPEDTVKATKEKIWSIYKKLQGGGDFAKLAKQYSIDRRSADQGGELPLFSTGDMIPEFESAAFSLKNKGSFSEPILTPFGWHIIKLIDKKPLESLEVMKNDLMTKIKSDDRDEKGKLSVVKNLKVAMNYKLIGSIKDYYKVVDNSIYSGKWNKEKAKILTGDLFSVQNQKVTKQQFTNYLAENHTITDTISVQNYVNKAYDDFVGNYILKLEEDGLEAKYPDFKYLIQEYHDGILLFELTDKMVWSKAISDTIGLNHFYQKIKKNYMIDKRIDMSIYTYKEPKTAVKARKIFTSKLKEGLAPLEIVNLLNHKAKDTIRKVEAKTYFKGENALADSVFLKLSKNEINETCTHLFVESLNKLVLIHKIIAPEPKTLNEIRGIVTSEYQNFLEKEWIDKLKLKYPQKTDEKVLNSIK